MTHSHSRRSRCAPKVDAWTEIRAKWRNVNFAVNLFPAFRDICYRGPCSSTRLLGEGLSSSTRLLGEGLSSSPQAMEVIKQEYGEEWPFSVSSDNLYCDAASSAVVMGVATTNCRMHTLVLVFAAALSWLIGINQVDAANSLDMMAAVFVGGHSRTAIERQISTAMRHHAIPTTDGGYNKAGSVLVVLRKETGVAEMDILRCINSAEIGAYAEFGEAAAICATLLSSQ